jgi:hypothetical protein
VPRNRFEKSIKFKLDVEQLQFFSKCLEELSKLSVELLQAINKVNKNNNKKILSEIEDAKKYLKELKSVLL